MLQKLFTASALGFLLASLPLASSVPYGLQIYSCTKPGVIAPGFDDGPWIYSESILNRMEAAGFKATWFINGANKGNIYDYNSTLRRMVGLGHQIGSHTWSHKDLATLTAEGVKQEMVLLEEAMMNILGYFPFYMRPPYLSVNAQALKVLKDLEYHVIIGDLNTKDWEYQTKSGIEIAKGLFTSGLDQGYTIVEAHEQEPYSHDVLIDYMIEVIKQRNLTTVTVAECLQDTNVYRSVRAPVPTTSVGPEPTVVYTLNGRCGNINAGGNMGWTCSPSYGRCCSKYGNCGSTADYCAPSVCQPEFGVCGGVSSSAATVVTSTLSTARIAAPTNPATSQAATPSGIVSPDGTCGIQGSGKGKGYICKAGQCCSKYGNCGATSDYCAGPVCQLAFGKCDPMPGRGSVSPDGTCGDIAKGNNNGYVCKPGQCCSKYGNCGATADYCAASVCQIAFGSCTGVSSSSSPPVSSVANSPASVARLALVAQASSSSPSTSAMAASSNIPNATQNLAASSSNPPVELSGNPVVAALQSSSVAASATPRAAVVESSSNLAAIVQSSSAVASVSSYIAAVAPTSLPAAVISSDPTIESSSSAAAESTPSSPTSHTTPLKATPDNSVGASPSSSVEDIPSKSVENVPSISIGASPSKSTVDIPSSSVEASPSSSVEASPSSSVEASPSSSVEASPSSALTVPTSSTTPDVSIEASRSANISSNGGDAQAAESPSSTAPTDIITTSRASCSGSTRLGGQGIQQTMY